MRSLRFRLPLFFVLGILVAGLVTALFAVRLFQDYTRDRTFDELQQQARGPGEISGLTDLDRSALDWSVLERGDVQTLEFVPPDSDRVFLAAAHPIKLGG